MRAIIYTKYGPADVLQLREIEKPAPKANEVLIKVHATTVTAGDWRARSLILPKGFALIGRLAFGITGPRKQILGMEFSGEIQEIGKDVTKFKVGDRVFADSGLAFGAYVEFKTMVEDGAIALIPGDLTYEEAAPISFGGTTALSFLVDRGKIQAGNKVLINGASGGTGTAGIQVAKSFGAEVTGVCSGSNVEMVKSLGADKVIDYTKEDFTTNGETYDLIYDTIGTKSVPSLLRALKENGRILLILGDLPHLIRIPWVSLISNKKMFGGTATGGGDKSRFLAKLVEEGKYKPVIDRIYPFEQIAEAHDYVGKGHKKGNVVITLDVH